jgi:lysophospholipase L1-like esterase
MISFAGLRRTAIFVVTLLAALALWAAPASAVAPPKVMVALGDSITRAFNSDGPGCPTGPSLDCPKNSWSTGTDPAVNSQFQRIQAIDPGRNPVPINDAVSGARAGTDRTTPSGDPIDLVPQAQKAATQNPDYVTIEIGANDACRQTISDQTPTDTFSTHVETALSTLVTADPKVYIQVASIPDINNLWDLFTDVTTTPPTGDPNALFRWSPGGLSANGTCQALLANPLSTAQADSDRREAFQDQVSDYNDALAGVCAEFKRCLFDNNAVFDSRFTAADVATVTNTAPLPNGFIPADYFHPSLLGQASLAETTWNATFPMN